MYNLLRYYNNDSCELLSCSNVRLDKMATTTMHFGPEWMRKQATAATRSSQADFHHGTTTSISGLNPTVPTPQSPSCSTLVSSVPVNFEKRDGGHLLRYSKEEMIRIYREGMNSTLGPGVERWEGIIREIAADPIGTKDMTDVEKRVSPTCCLTSCHRTHNS